MSSNLVRKLTPEEEELASKASLLKTMESELAQRELDLATLHVDLHAFERQYQKTIGIKYLELDQIETQIAQYIDYLEEVRNFTPSESLKKLYREVAKQIHPDLATDETEREHRKDLMIEVNQAYEDGDEERLHEILYRWQSNPETVKGNGLGAELIRTLRKISQSRDRIAVIEEEYIAVMQTELYELKKQVNIAEESGTDLLGEMAFILDEQIFEAQQRLDELKETIEI